MDIFKKWACKVCNKRYSSQTSLCNHKRIYHKETVINTKNISENNSNNIEIINEDNNKVEIIQTETVQSNNYPCRHCKQIYKHIQSRWKHENKCKSKIDINKINQDLESNNEEKYFNLFSEFDAKEIEILAKIKNLAGK